MRFLIGLLFLSASILQGQLNPFTPGDPLVVVQDGKYGYIDHEGRIVIKPQFIWGTWFSKGLATVYLCGREVSIDRTGKILPKRIALEGELVPKPKDKKVGFVDSSGEFRIAPTFDDVMPFAESLAAVKVGPKWGFINSAGEFVIPPRFKYAFYFLEGIGTAIADEGYVLIDKAGEVIAVGESHANVAQGRIPFTRGGRSGFLDMKGSVAVPFVYDAVSQYSEGLAAVEQQGKWGFIDRDGQVVIPLEFDKVSEFSKGLAPAKRGERTGFIDHTGRFAFELPFEYSDGFIADDVAIFWTVDSRTGYLNTSGRVIWGPARGGPDHKPLLGWTDEDKRKSCEGVPQAVREMIVRFPNE
jgi:hypothetical protein